MRTPKRNKLFGHYYRPLTIDEHNKYGFTENTGWVGYFIVILGLEILIDAQPGDPVAPYTQRSVF